MSAVILWLLAVCWMLIPTVPVIGQVDGITLDDEDPCGTAVLLSQAGFAPGVEGVVVATAEDLQVASCAAVLAAAYDGPLLLTPDDSLARVTEKEIARLEPERVFLVGVEATVAAAVAHEFRELALAGRVVMVSGADIYETSRLVAHLVSAKTGGAEDVVLTLGGEGASAGATAVAASSLAAVMRWPLVFVEEQTEEQAAVLVDVDRTMADLGVDRMVLVGFQMDLGEGLTSTTIEGRDQYEVSANIAQQAVDLGLEYAHMVVVPGSAETVVHGVAAGPYMARNCGVVVLCGDDELSPATTSVLTGVSEHLNRVDFCGPLGLGGERARLVLETRGLPSGVGVAKLRRSSEGEEVAWLEQRLADLSYRPGPVDGVFDSRTRDAVIAFQKWEGLDRDGIVGEDVWWRMLEAERPVPRFAEEGAWIEVDKKRQVLLYCVDGVVERTLPVSTGNASIGMVTPSGVFHITRENTHERLRYKPLYLRSYGVLAIHGYKNVPTFPASHGCVRTTKRDMDELHNLIPVGTMVRVY